MATRVEIHQGLECAICFNSIVTTGSTELIYKRKVAAPATWYKILMMSAKETKEFINLHIKYIKTKLLGAKLNYLSKF